jgi:hypothetical protein
VKLNESAKKMEGIKINTDKHSEMEHTINAASSHHVVENKYDFGGSRPIQYQI